jgi:hypothetical protein
LFVAYYPVISKPGLFLELFPNCDDDDDDRDDAIADVDIDGTRFDEQLDEDC